MGKCTNEEVLILEMIEQLRGKPTDMILLQRPPSLPARFGLWTDREIADRALFMVLRGKLEDHLHLLNIATTIGAKAVECP
jgi:hypothetical protein